MCSSLAGCEDGGDCYSCRKIGESVDWEPYGSKWQSKKQEVLRTQEQEAASLVFFEKMLIKAQLAGDIYRNNLKNLYNAKGDPFNE